jgi:hypothetical protein
MENTGILAKEINGELHYGEHVGTLYHAADHVGSTEEVGDGWFWFESLEKAKEHFNIQEEL